MTDSDAKKCLKRILEIENKLDEIRDLKDSSGFWQGLGIIVACVLAIFIADALPDKGKMVSWIIIALIKIAIIFGAVIVGGMFSIAFILQIPEFIKLHKRTKKYGNYLTGSKYFVDMNNKLMKEKLQLDRMLNNSFPHAEVGSYRAKDILAFMDRGYDYYEACHLTRQRMSAEAERNRFIKEAEERNNRIRREKDLINEMQRVNQNLENIQRQQEYENNLREREYSRREYEDLKRRCNKKL